MHNPTIVQNTVNIQTDTHNPDYNTEHSKYITDTHNPTVIQNTVNCIN